MLDPACTFVEHMDDVRAGLRNRGLQPDSELEQLATLEARRRRLIPELEGLEARSERGRRRGRARQATGQDASAIFAANKARAQQIRQLEIELDQVEQQRTGAADDAAQPAARERAGRDERRGQRRSAAARRAARRSTSSRKPHWELGPALGIIDFERATKMSGARFSVLLRRGRPAGARADQLHARSAHA